MLKTLQTLTSNTAQEIQEFEIHNLVKGKLIKCKDFTLYLESTFKDFTDLYSIIKAAENWEKHQPNIFSTCLKAPDKLCFYEN